MGARVERIALYAVVLALAVAVGWLALTLKAPANACDDCGDCVDCEDELGPRFDAIDEAIGGLGKTVADAVTRSLAGFKQGVVDDVASRVEVLVSAQDAETVTTLDRMDAAVGQAVADVMAGSLASFRHGVADDVASRVGALVSAHGDETAAALGSVDAAVGKAVTDAMAGSLASFKQGVSDDVASRVGALVSAHGDETATALGGVDAAVGKAVTDAMADGLASFRQGVADDVASRVGMLVAAHGDETTVALNGIDASVNKTIDESLAGLEERVASAVSKSLLAEGCALRKEGEDCIGAVTPQPPPCPTPEAVVCGDGQPAITVNSKFTFFYENARLNANGDVVESSLGIALAPRHDRRLELLTNAFQPCNRAGAAVEFRVTGYSSTADFRVQPDGTPMSNSDELNRKTANLRARIVGSYLRSQGFEVETKQWPSQHDLQRPYLDDAQPGMDQQALNRTVFIELRSAGACNLSQ